MNPKPLARILADDLLQHGVQTAGILSCVARYLKWRMKFKNVLSFPLETAIAEAWNNRCTSFSGDFREGGISAGRDSEEVDKDTFLLSDVF